MGGESGTGLPASLEAAWGVRARPNPGPKPGLSLERIVAAAVALAAAEGMAAVSMVRVAKELGVSTMALYRYVAAKDELVELMMDAGVGLPPAGDDGGDWRAGLSRWSRDYLDVLRRQPWILQITIAGPPITPNQIAWLERGLGDLRDTGLAESEKLSVVMLLGGFVRNWAALAVSMAQAGDRAFRYGSALSKLIDERRFPAVSAAIAGGAIDDDQSDADADAEFTFGLGRILDGIQALMNQRRT